MSCTGIKVTSKSGQTFWGRTQEFDLEFDYIGVVFPKGLMLEQSFIKTKTRYCFGGIGIADEGEALHFVADGVNEKGLSGGTFYFGNYNRYLSLAEIGALGKKPLSGVEFVTWALATCNSVDEVRKRAEEVAITHEAGPFWASFPQHCVFQDSSGRSIVVEPSIPGGFEIYDNPVGVFTNSPKFDWHLANLQNYVGLTDTIKPGRDFGEAAVVSSGKGNGLFGLPGDFTAQSRFVRAVVLTELAQPVENHEAISLLFHLLDTSDIPKGVVKTEIGVQYTQYTSGYDLTEKRIYLHTYDNRQIQSFSLDDLRGSQEVLVFEIDQQQKIAIMKPRKEKISV